MQVPNRAERLLIGELLSHNQDGICFLLSGPRGLLAPCVICVHLFRRDDHFLPGNLAEEVFAGGDVLVHQS
jgi:hypothetical protein